MSESDLPLSENNKLTIEQIQHKLPDAVKILAGAPVFYVGWEMDNEVCLVEFKDGSRKLVASSHGTAYLAKREEFEIRIQDYRTAIEQTEHLLALLGKKS